MNLWVRKGGLMILSALIFFSCEEEISTVGLPPENNLGIFFAELRLNDKISEVWIDSINTQSTQSIILGQYDDPYFGHIEAKNFSEVNLPTANPGATFDATATFDSLVVQMRIGDIYGINDQPLNIEIYQLAQTIELDRDTTNETSEPISYYTFSSQDYAQKIGEASLAFDPDSLGLLFEDTNLNEDDERDSTIKANFYDTDGEYIYLSKIKLDQSFGQAFFDKIKNQDEEFDNSFNFSLYFKGLGLTSTDGNTITTYQLASSNSKMVLYYSETEDGVTTQKTVSFSFSSGRSYNNISPNRNVMFTGSQFDEINTFYQPYEIPDFAYAQSGTGLYPKLDLSFFKGFTNTDSTKNAVIDRAQLIIKDPQNISDLLNPPQQLTFSLTTTEELAKGNYLQDVIRSALNPSQALTAVYDSALNAYKADIPQYLRNIDHGISALDQVLITSPNSNRKVERLKVRKEDIYIEIYYTVPENPVRNE